MEKKPLHQLAHLGPAAAGGLEQTHFHQIITPNWRKPVAVVLESLGYFIMLEANTRPGLLLWWVFKKKLPKYEQIAESREAAVLGFHYTGHRGKTEESATPHMW